MLRHSGSKHGRRDRSNNPDPVDRRRSTIGERLGDLSGLAEQRYAG
jgi:hypothetical protein